LIRNRHKDIPLFLFGESMGAPVIINFLAKYKVSINGIILFSPAVKLKLSLKQILSVIPLSLIYLFAPGVPIINMNSGRNSTGISNPIHLEYDRTDELHLKKISIRYLLTLNKIIKKAFKLASVITQPILIIQGENDPVLNIDGIEQFFDECSSRDKELVIINNATHALFTDPNACSDKQNIWKILKEWLDKH